MLLYLKEEGVKYHPDVVMVGFAYLDVYRNLWNFFAYAKPKFKLLSGRLLLSNVPVPTPDHLLAEEPYRSKARDLMVILRDKLRTQLGSQEREARELTGALLDEIVATTRSIGGVPVFVYLSVPSEWKESKRIPDSSENRIAISSLAAEHERFLYEYCQQRGTACLFLGPRFREEVNKGMDFSAAGHWNAQGHKLAAEEISDFLLQRNLIAEVERHSASQRWSSFTHRGRDHRASALGRPARYFRWPLAGLSLYKTTSLSDPIPPNIRNMLDAVRRRFCREGAPFLLKGVAPVSM
jgi:hypothetical protein